MVPVLAVACVMATSSVIEMRSGLTIQAVRAVERLSLAHQYGPGELSMCAGNLAPSARLEGRGGNICYLLLVVGRSDKTHLLLVSQLP